MIVVPTAAQRQVAREIALMRRHGKEKRKFVRGDMDVGKTDFLGVLAEIVAAGLFGVTPNMDYKFIDDGFDFNVNAVKVEVRHSLLNNARLIIAKTWQLPSELKADAYMLVTGDQTKMKIAGYVPRAKVSTVGKLINLGYGQTLCVAQEDLSPVEELLNVVS
jgi:hypothetical protein